MSSYGSDAEITAKKNLCRIEKDEYATALSGKRTRPDELGRIWKGGRERSARIIQREMRALPNIILGQISI